MIILDTNVVSETLRPQPNQRVLTWLEQLTDDVAITTITVAELLAGLQRLPPGRRRTSLTEQVENALEPYLGTRAILPFDTESARSYARIVAARERAGRPISMADAEIAAICRSNGAACATRSTGDFEGTGIELIDPWAS